jgi:hypothetical protein
MAARSVTALSAFVIQIHSGCGPTHYDLMLESGALLATWQLAASPEGMKAGQEIPARRLKEHRREYLTYEGEVSKGRGRVDRLDGGEFEIESQEESRWVFALHGGRISGEFELRRTGEDLDAWVLRRVR